ncbi:glycoside hydrolase [Opitutaceae bacterium EW11]|nr:glycoside hydrolase [Opitutaceae bacterium EW11]
MKKLLVLFLAIVASAWSAPETTTLVGAAEQVLPGVWRFRIGEPEAITPTSTRRYLPAASSLAALQGVATPPVAVTGAVTDRGVLVRIPLLPDEQIYGLGLQLQSFQQRASKKLLRVNADPQIDTGDTHAPVPFYVTTRGYGVFVDTARYATFYLGNKVRVSESPSAAATTDKNDGWNGVPPYDQKRIGHASDVWVEVPRTQGVDVYVFAGPSMREAVQRYNLFSGGGPIPPRWGLGFWYRCESNYTQDEVLKLAADFRERRIPCDVLGLEPHWQSHSYSSSYLWSKRIPEPGRMVGELAQQHYRLNLWEQPFVHPSSPVYGDLRNRSGDFEVWGGLVPDFIDPAARAAFASLHEKTHLSLGVAGYKADECDNSDLVGNWSFPEISRFPSGADGELMHSLFGLRYLDALQTAFEHREQRTYGLVRSAGALAAPYPYVLYSDLYDHRQFVHGVAQASFSGLLWTPEVRDSSGGPAELVRRLQAAAFSPLAMINAWYLKNPPWKQVNRAANNSGSFSAGWEKTEARCRAVLELRMRFVPYLHAAFVRYHREGLPPFRALVLDYPDDPAARTVDDEYMMGDSVLVAPVIVPTAPRNRPTDAPPTVGEESRRSVYLPPGDWYDFWTGERVAGGRRFEVVVPIDRIPLYVRSGSVLPLATPTLHTDDAASWRLTAQVYGPKPRPIWLFEDDGSFAPKLPEVRIEWDETVRACRLVRTDDAAPGAPAYQLTATTAVN